MEVNHKNAEYVFLFEKSNVNLNVSDSKEYILDGIAAVFGTPNNNERIYDEIEYLPHLEYLNKKIAQNRLCGELDHPEKFDISLKNISHVIEELVYDKAKRQVRIRVRLLDTPAGMIARSLVDAGIPISISSRAAGVVGNDKKVKIKKIFTYDLVMEPGFENAQLSRVDESLSFTFGEKRKGSILSSLTDISKSFNYNKNIRIYSLNENDSDFRKLIESEPKNNNTKMENNFVTIEEMNEYSLILKNELESAKTEIAALKEQLSTSSNGSIAEERIGKIETYMKYLAENLDKNISYSKYLAESVDKNISYSNYLAENLDKGIAFSNYLAENLDKGIDFSNYLAENLDKGIAFSNYLAENMDKAISFANYLAENVDKNISYSNYLAENLDKGIAFSNYLAENVDKSIAFADYLAEKVEGNISYSEHIAESINKKFKDVKKVNESVENKNTKIEAIKESIKTLSYSNIETSVDTILNTVKKQKAVNEGKDNFLYLINEGKRNEFLSLDETKKEKVRQVLATTTSAKEADVLKAIKNVINEGKEVPEPKFIAEMPEKYVPIWESLNDKQKESIVAQASVRTLNTDYQIKNFWSTRNLMQEKTGVTKLNENFNPATTTKLGYSTDYLTSMADEIGKKFGK